VIIILKWAVVAVAFSRIKAQATLKLASQLMNGWKVHLPGGANDCLYRREWTVVWLTRPLFKLLDWTADLMKEFRRRLLLKGSTLLVSAREWHRGGNNRKQIQIIEPRRCVMMMMKVTFEEWRWTSLENVWTNLTANNKSVANENKRKPICTVCQNLDKTIGVQELKSSKIAK
jgi:hypothetical protein